MMRVFLIQIVLFYQLRDGLNSILGSNVFLSPNEEAEFSVIEEYNTKKYSLLGAFSRKSFLSYENKKNEPKEALNIFDRAIKNKFCEFCFLCKSSDIQMYELLRPFKLSLYKQFISLRMQLI